MSMTPRDPEDVEYIAQLEGVIERLLAERLKLDKRIHNQRVALRQTWEIMEMRRKWLGSDTARKKYADLYGRYRALLGLPALGQTTRHRQA